MRKTAPLYGLAMRLHWRRELRASGFHGADASWFCGCSGDVPVYCSIVRKTPSLYDFVYWTFYPFNGGKNVCIGLLEQGRCSGRRSKT